MAVHNLIEYAKVDELFLDPMNPRLGRERIGHDVAQKEVLEFMRDWTLDELAVSFIESGFWVQEALLVVEETLYGKQSLVVIEGNRRLAALKYLKQAVEGSPISKKWADIVSEKNLPENLFERIPYIKADYRSDVEAFLGFRHVTGIKEWKPAEKAEFIAKLINDRQMSYAEVSRKIGSKTPAVRQNYLTYNLFLQMQSQEKISIEQVESKFSVLYLSLRTQGVRDYLGLDINAEPEKAKYPVSADKLYALENFAIWLFGDDKTAPLFTDSRLVDDFATILESPAAVDYLERTEKPNFEIAFRTAGGDEPEIIRYVERAADNIELSLTKAHLYLDSEKLQKAVKRFSADSFQIIRLFPDTLNSFVEAAKK